MVDLRNTIKKWGQIQETGNFLVRTELHLPSSGRVFRDR